MSKKQKGKAKAANDNSSDKLPIDRCRARFSYGARNAALEDEALMAVTVWLASVLGELPAKEPREKKAPNPIDPPDALRQLLMAIIDGNDSQVVDKAEPRLRCTTLTFKAPKAPPPPGTEAWAKVANGQVHLSLLVLASRHQSNQFVRMLPDTPPARDLLRAAAQEEWLDNERPMPTGEQRNRALAGLFDGTSHPVVKRLLALLQTPPYLCVHLEFGTLRIKNGNIFVTRNGEEMKIAIEAADQGFVNALVGKVAGTFAALSKSSKCKLASDALKGLIQSLPGYAYLAGDISGLNALRAEAARILEAQGVPLEAMMKERTNRAYPVVTPNRYR